MVDGALPVEGHFTPAVIVLPCGSVVHRVFGNLHGPAEFNPGFGESSHFSFFGDPVVPVLYAAEDIEGAVSEGVLHHLPPTGGVLFPARYEDRIAAGLATNRELSLAIFQGFPSEHADTAAWARVVWELGLDGCAWQSPRHVTSRAYVFFDRAADAFTVAPEVAPRVFANGPDLDWLIDFCAYHRIEVQVI